MYRPNFCVDCGTRIIRLRWHPWTSRRFCDHCAVRFRKKRILGPILIAILLIGAGLVAGRAGRPAPPPLTIERVHNSPLSPGDLTSTHSSNSQVPTDPQNTTTISPEANATSAGQAGQSSDVVYICGARTRKGTPCQRRVHGPVRCWQHKGMAAMLPQEKLLISDSEK
jgi:hypothetical protein